MIKKASTLVLTLRDQNNQSVREQERLKEELDLQRTFLSLHLKQTVQLMQLNKQLIDEKVFALQNVSIELIHRQISLLENTLKDYLESRLENLRQERVLINEHLKHIRNDMASLPKKWAAEQLLEQEVETNKLIVEEIAKMVESKNITHNLEMIQSAPIDLSIPPVHPIMPKVFLFTILGFLFGGLFGSGLAFGKTITKGIDASPDNLRQMGYSVAGKLSSGYHGDGAAPISDGDLETLRRLQSYVDPEGKLLLLVEGRGPDYSKDLSALFKKKNKKVLRIYLDFDSSTSDIKSGLLQYLEGSVSSPTIHSGEEGDLILPGGMSRFSTELLSSEAFHSLIDQLKQRYDWIIGITHASPASVEADSLLTLFPNVVVTLSDEKVEELSNYPDRKTVFLFASNGQ